MAEKEEVIITGPVEILTMTTGSHPPGDRPEVDPYELSYHQPRIDASPDVEFVFAHADDNRVGYLEIGLRLFLKWMGTVIAEDQGTKEPPQWLKKCSEIDLVDGICSWRLIYNDAGKLLRVNYQHCYHIDFSTIDWIEKHFARNADSFDKYAVQVFERIEKETNFSRMGRPSVPENLVPAALLDLSVARARLLDRIADFTLLQTESVLDGYDVDMIIHNIHRVLFTFTGCLRENMEHVPVGLKLMDGQHAGEQAWLHVALKFGPDEEIQTARLVSCFQSPEIDSKTRQMMPYLETAFYGQNGDWEPLTMYLDYCQRMGWVKAASEKISKAIRSAIPKDDQRNFLLQ